MRAGNVVALAIVAILSAPPATPVIGADATVPLEARTHGDVRYLSGGVGLEEVQVMRALGDQFNLKLTFARAGTGEYLADIRVLVQDAKGARVLDQVSDGPLFYARLPEGRYKVSVEGDGRTLTRSTDLRRGQRANLVFHWPAWGTPPDERAGR